MVITPKNQKIRDGFKQKTKGYCICPLCNKRLDVGIELSTLKKLHSDILFPYPHLILHDDHALICYIDKNLSIRGIEAIKSIEISRDSETFANIMRRWSNPY